MIGLAINCPWEKVCAQKVNGLEVMLILVSRAYAVVLPRGIKLSKKKSQNPFRMQNASLAPMSYQVML